MNKTMLFILLTVAALVACGAGAGETLTTQALPKDFEHLRLGISENELRSARPAIRRDDFPYSSNYFERLPPDHPSGFRDITYAFDKHDGLVQVIFSWSGPLPELERRCGAFLDSTIQRLGEPHARRVNVVDRHYATGSRIESPALDWKSADAIVTATCLAVSEKADNANFYQLAISKAEIAATRSKGAKTRPADAAEHERLFGGLLERRADAPELR